MSMCNLTEGTWVGEIIASNFSGEQLSTGLEFNYI